SVSASNGMPLVRSSGADTCVAASVNVTALKTRSFSDRAIDGVSSPPAGGCSSESSRCARNFPIVSSTAVVEFGVAAGTGASAEAGSGVAGSAGPSVGSTATSDDASGAAETDGDVVAAGTDVVAAGAFACSLGADSLDPD